MSFLYRFVFDRDQAQAIAGDDEEEENNLPLNHKTEIKGSLDAVPNVWLTLRVVPQNGPQGNRHKIVPTHAPRSKRSLTTNGAITNIRVS